MPDKKKIYIILIAICVIAAVTEIFFADPHYSNIWNTLPGAGEAGFSYFCLRR